MAGNMNIQSQTFFPLAKENIIWSYILKDNQILRKQILTVSGKNQISLIV